MKPTSQDSPESVPPSLEELIDAVCLRFERCWQVGETPILEEYLEGAAASQRGPLLAELLPLEFYYRTQRGEHPTAEEYTRRFPGHEEQIRSLLPKPPPAPDAAGSTRSELSLTGPYIPAEPSRGNPQGLKPRERKLERPTGRTLITDSLGELRERLQTAEQARARAERQRRRARWLLAATVLGAVAALAGGWLWLRTERQAWQAERADQQAQLREEAANARKQIDGLIEQGRLATAEAAQTQFRLAQANKELAAALERARQNKEDNQPPGSKVGFRYQSVAFSPDGKHFASACLIWADTLKGLIPGEVTVWDAATGQLSFSLPSQGKGVDAVAYSPDGKWLAAAGTNVVTVWNPETRKEVYSFWVGGNSSSTRIDFSPDSKLLASACPDRTVKLWDLATGQVSLVLRGQSGYRCHVAFNKDGSLLASACAQTVKVWNVKTGEVQLDLQGHDTQVSCLAFSPDGRYLASAGQDGVLKVWDVTTGNQILSRPSDSKSSQFYSLAFSPDGQRLAAAGNGSLVKILDPLTGKQLLALNHSGRLFGVAFSRDGSRLASACELQTIKVWDAVMGKELFTARHTETVRPVDARPPNAPRPAEKLTVGKLAADIEGEDIDGKKFKLSDYRGKVILLDFWGHWCGPCRAMYPLDRALVKRLEGKPFVFLGVNSDPDKEVLKNVVAKEPITWRFFVDGQDGPIASNWEIQAWPTIVLIDHKGVIRLRNRGNPGEEILNSTIDKLIAEIRSK